MTSTENGVSEPPNLKDFWEPIPPDPPTRLVPSALTIMHPPPQSVTKNPSYGPGVAVSFFSKIQLKWSIIDAAF